MEKRVGELKVGDVVIGTDNKPHKITALGSWGRSCLFVSVDGKPDGAMRKSDVVEIVPACK
jgi:hypothetical protein